MFVLRPLASKSENFDDPTLKERNLLGNPLKFLAFLKKAYGFFVPGR